MRMQNPFGVRSSIVWRLVKAHRIGERYLKQIIVADSQFLVDLSQIPCFFGIQCRQAWNCPVCRYQRFERSDCPEGNECRKRVVTKQDTLFRFMFFLKVIEQEGATIPGKKLLL